MKNWKEARAEELNVNETAHNFLGIYHDGGYIGDGQISGHLSWDKPSSGNGGSGNGGSNDLSGSDVEKLS